MSEPNYLTTKWFLENLLAIEMNKQSKNEQTNLSRYVSIRNQENSNVQNLV